jgi:hypothetical protein
MLAYLAIVSTSAAAFFGAPVWAFLIGTALLMLLSAIEHRKLGMGAARNSPALVSWAAWQSAGHAMLAAGAAYGLGYVTRLGL